MALKTGQKPRHEALGLTIDDAKGMYRAMLLTRMLGERMMQMNRMGRAAFVGVADGLLLVAVTTRRSVASH